MRNTALTTDITERDKQGLMQRTWIIGMYVFLELCTQIMQLQLSAGLHNTNTVGQIWPNVFSVSDWLSSSNVLSFTFKHFYLPSPQNSHNRWWVTDLHSSPSLLGSSEGKRIYCKKASNTVFQLQARNLKELWASNCAKLGAHFPDPHFHWPHFSPKSSSWHWAPRLFLLPLVQRANQTALEFCCPSNVLN